MPTSERGKAGEKERSGRVQYIPIPLPLSCGDREIKPSRMTFIYVLGNEEPLYCAVDFL